LTYPRTHREALMAREKARKEKITIYLAKGIELSDDKVINIENAEPPIEITLSQGGGKLYVKKDPPKASPPWTKLFTAHPEVPPSTFGSASSVGAIFIYRTKEYCFALSFGTGFHLIKEDGIERDFGLRVTLNSVEPGRLRSLDKSTYVNNPLNSRTQSPSAVDIFDLEMDSESDMLYAVTGYSKEVIFGEVVTGRDALTLATETDLEKIPTLLAKAYDKYGQALPKEFEWVDNVYRVKDKEIIGVLDLELDDILKDFPQRTAGIILGEPEVVDWESNVGYSFDLRGKTPRHLVLELGHLADYLKEHENKLCTDTLKHQLIHINNAEHQSIKHWLAYRCLYAEIKVGKENYILRNGNWYSIDENFVNQVDAALSQLDQPPISLPIYNHDREDEYNEHVCLADKSFELMDKKNTSIGGRYDKLEFCDLIKDGRTLVHVKYYRSSATLSHLFSQGAVSAETFVKDASFRERLNGKLPVNSKLADTSSRPETGQYTIAYAIATTKKLPIDLPFFAKVTLKSALRNLKALGYRVELAAISVDPLVAKKKKYKPNK